MEVGVRRSFLALALAGCAHGVVVPVGPLDTVQQATGCRCGNSYISCNDTCHKGTGSDGEGGGVSSTTLLMVLGVLVVGGCVAAVIYSRAHQVSEIPPPGTTGPFVVNPVD